MPLRSTKDYSVGIIYFILFILTIPAMNWVVMNVGTVCTADGPCLIPVWPGIMAPSGVLMAGVALVLRDGLQAKLGVRWSLYAIIIGAALSALFSEPSLVLASVMAFFFSELADLVVSHRCVRNGRLGPLWQAAWSAPWSTAPSSFLWHSALLNSSSDRFWVSSGCLLPWRFLSGIFIAAAPKRSKTKFFPDK